jgi:ABC-type xylose transport system permease subunit
MAFAATGVIASGAASLQSFLITEPARDVTAYLAFWIVVAVACIAIIGIDVVTRSRRIHFGFADEMIQAAVEQLLPALVVGALLTFVIWRFAPQAGWMLPGLWQIVLSLGIFASCRVLPAPMMAFGVWYLITGLACLALAADDQAFSPWAMGLPFGVGQLSAALLIHYLRTSDAAD